MSRTDYSTYLRIPDLLQLQQPLTEGAHDEMLFVIVHQVYELWFKLILHELDDAALQLRNGSAQGAAPRLTRVTRIWDVLTRQLRVLETMSPEGFLAFRDPLTPASGLQSGQFRAIEAVSGLRELARPDDPSLSERDREILRGRMQQPTLYECFCACMRSNGFDMPDGDRGSQHDSRLRALASLYRDHESAPRALLHHVCELLLDHDEALSVWRVTHAYMAEREIGARTGTGGEGVGYLQRTVRHRCFPELWEVRTAL